MSKAIFKNKKFHNMYPTENHSIWEMLGAWMKSDIKRAKWPKWIDSTVDENPIKNFGNHDKVRITYINHASFLIQLDNINILTDPIFANRASPFSFAGPKRIHKSGIAIDKLPKIDILLISHDHYDHLDKKSIQYLIKRDNPKIYTGLGVAKRLKYSSNIIELDWGDSIKIFDNFKLYFLNTQHFSGRTLRDRNTTLWGAFLLQINNKTIYFGGDSGYEDHYKNIYDAFGKIDISFIPIGAYSPRKFFQPIHMDPFEAVKAHMELRSNLSIGMHYGTFQMSAEPYNEPKILLKEAIQKNNLKNNEFITLKIGSPINI